jgi:hypothetical protein
MPARWPPTLTLRGPWAADVTYEPGDVVPDGGQTWRAVHRNLNARPPSSAWTRQVPGGGVGAGGGHTIVGQDGATTMRAGLHFAHEEPAEDAWGNVSDVPPSGGETVVTYPTPPLLPPREELEAIVGTGTPFTDLGLVAADFAVPTPPIARLQGALDNAGISRLRGAVKALHTGTHVIATLPYALSPFRPMRFAIPKGSGSLTVLTIGADNKLTVTANANDILYFDGVHFPSPNYGYVSGTADPVQFQEEQPYVRCVVNITDAPYHPTNVYRICVNIAMIGPDDESWYVGGTDS